ncbi:uncharacterized protein LOC117122982 isoform X2 [Anneissia japonica]|nr:uncharacterized protein LOC117122982 isoform X2 [Anneissia japonica]
MNQCSFCWCTLPIGPASPNPSALDQTQIVALNTFREWFINEGQSAEALYDRTQPVFELTPRQEKAILNSYGSLFQGCKYYNIINKECVDQSSHRTTRSANRICSVIQQTTPYYAALTENDEPVVVVQVSLQIFQEFSEELCSSASCNYFGDCLCKRGFRLTRALVYNTQQQEVYIPTLGDIKARSCNAYHTH